MSNSQNLPGGLSYSDAWLLFWKDPIGGLKSIYGDVVTDPLNHQIINPITGQSTTEGQGLNAVNGRVTSGQASALAMAASNSVYQAKVNGGASATDAQAAATAAANEVKSFINTQEGGTAEQYVSSGKWFVDLVDPSELLGTDSIDWTSVLLVIGGLLLVAYIISESL